MKTAKKIRASVCIVLVLAMLLCTAVFFSVGTAAAGSVGITYSFANNNSGYAEGRISLSGNTADYGTYRLYWADGTQALNGYREIATLKLNSASASFRFAEFTAIPAGATKLIAIKGDAEPTVKTVAAAAAVYTLPANKLFRHTQADRQTSFQALSDVHIDKQSVVYYTNSDKSLSNALKCAVNRNADFITICGDIVNGYNNSAVKEWQAYQKILADSDFCNPVYEASGNHEIKSELIYGLDAFNTATGLNTVSSAIQSNPYYEVTAKNGDHFIFMTLEKGSSPNEVDEFSAAQLSWLKGLLAKYSNDGHNIFIYEHALFSGYGAGDNKLMPLYAGSLQDSHSSTKQLKAILEQYPQVFFLSGHTHMDFECGYNIDNENGTTAYTVHIPSTSATTHIVGGSLDYTMYEESSQGYFIDVYDDCVVFNGTNLHDDEIYPAYTYFVDQSGEPIDKNTILDDPAGQKVTVEVDLNGCCTSPTYVFCHTYGENGEGESAFPGTPMRKTTDGTYIAEVPADYPKMCFVFYNADYGKLTSKEYDVNNCKVVIGTEKITYTKPAAWTSCYAYMWSDSTTGVSWNGLKMTADSTGKYSVSVPSETYTMVIFNDGADLKTVDLSITPYITPEKTGSYTITEAPPVPTSTAPPVSTATEPTSAATQSYSTATQPTTVTPPSSTATSPSGTGDDYLPGDADENSVVNVRDATGIQKCSALLATLTPQGMINADVNGDSNVNVKDATLIQKFAAEMISEFPVEKTKSVAPVGATSSELTTLMTTVKATLSDDYRYASFDNYMALKKAYYTYKDKTVSTLTQAEINTAYSSINTALTNFKALKTSNNIVTVYFSDAKSWGSVSAYVWYGTGASAVPLAPWGGSGMCYIRTNSSNQKIYAITVNQSKFKNIIFNSGSNQTVDIPMPSVHNTGYYPDVLSSGKYTIGTYVYSDK